MSFIYPRMISIARPGAQSGVGPQGYGGQTRTSETVVVSGLPASIQQQRQGSPNPTGLPGDATVPLWSIYIPLTTCALGTIKARDIVTDDVGARYQVLAPGWDSLGYRLTARTLEA